MRKLLITLVLIAVAATFADAGQVIKRRPVEAGGGGGRTQVSDAFPDDPAARWEIQWGAFEWAGGGFYKTESGGGGGYSIYNTTIGNATQYAYVQLVDTNGGPVLRGTGTAADGYYVVINFNGTVYLQRANGSGWIADEDSATLSFAANDYMGVTIQGTGTGTTVKIWKNPSAPNGTTVPYSKDAWDNSGDTSPDAEMTGTAAAVYNTGTYVGLGLDSAGVSFDNFIGGGF